MELPVLHEVVSRWSTTGSISTQERAELKVKALQLMGLNPGERCTTCPDFWNDVQHILKFHLKSNGFPIMAAKARKWRIIGDVYLPTGSSVHYVNEGVKADHIEVITDKVAEELMKRNPDLKGSIFEIDPDHVEPAKSPAKEPAGDAAKPATGKTGKKVNSPVVKPQPVDPAKEPAGDAAKPADDADSENGQKSE